MKRKQGIASIADGVSPVAKKVLDRVRVPIDRFVAGDFKTQSASGVVAKRVGKIEIHEGMKSLPRRAANGDLLFDDHPEFRPNLTPSEVLHMGSFGGTYFRPIHSKVTGESYKDVWKELPSDWLEGLDISRQVASSTYKNSVNYYGVNCGGDLEMWESSGWISDSDPYGWFQWYCRFYQGRRCSDDDRQISRGNGVIGPKGRWRINLVNKCITAGGIPSEIVTNKTIAPKVRQLLQHWGYKLTVDHLLRKK